MIPEDCVDAFDLLAQRDRELKELEEFLTKVDREVTARQARIKLLNELIQRSQEEQHETE